MRDMTFEKITTSDEKFVWAHVEKPFTKKAAVLVGQKIAEKTSPTLSKIADGHVNKEKSTINAFAKVATVKIAI